MKVIQYSTNQYGEMIPAEVRPALPMPGAFTAQKVQSEGTTFDGFGVAITGSSCYNLAKMPRERRREVLEEIYGKDGLGLSVARLSVGSSDYSAELYSYDDVPGDTELVHFSVARDEEYIIPMLREILQIAPELKIFASPWSPPGWMKTGGAMCGGYMREEYVECYARYLTKFILAYREHGIEISAVTPQNEPEAGHHGNMPACVWHPEIEMKFVSALKTEFRKAGLSTEIWCLDHNFELAPRVDWCLSQSEGFRRDCDGIAFHYYGGSVEQTSFLREKYPELKLHFTEGGPRLYDNYATDLCKWGTVVCSVLNCGYSTFTGWNLMLDETGGPNIGPFFCGGLLTRNRQSNEIAYSGQYKAFRHFSPFIDGEARILPLTFSGNLRPLSQYPKTDPSPVGTVAVSKGRETLFLVNPKGAKAQVQYEYGGRFWYFELLPETVATVVFEE